jgi:hypothetical protein
MVWYHECGKLYNCVKEKYSKLASASGK